MINFFKIGSKRTAESKVVALLTKKFPDMTAVIPDLLKEIQQLNKNGLIQDFLNEHSVMSPVIEKQETEIMEFISHVIHEKFDFSKSLAEQLAIELLYDENDPDKPKQQSKVSVSSSELKSVKDKIIGIDVIYEKEQSSQFQRNTRIFIKLDEYDLREHSQVVKLTWDSLLPDIKEALLEKDKQRFIIFPRPSNE
jgi:hypothetical protein